MKTYIKPQLEVLAIAADDIMKLSNEAQGTSMRGFLSDFMIGE